MLKSTMFMIELKDPSASNEIAGLLPYDAKFIMEGNQYIPVPAAIAEKIIHPLRQGNIISISDRLKENKHGPISLDDFEVKVPSQLEQKKTQEIMKAYDRFGVTVSRTSIIKHYMYFSTAILLAERGFMITDDNREEKYLEIINTGDEYLLKTLEDYLEARDNLAELSLSYKEFQEYVLKLRAAENDEELEAAMKETPF